MRLRVLGCSGGIGQNRRTSSFLLDDDILLDAGTGVGDLTLDEMRRIKHIFVTHSHMDHIATIPLLVDTLFSDLNQPLMVHARQETIELFKQHIFNWAIWPDFTELPTRETPVMTFKIMHPGEVVEINGRHIEMVEVNHTVPAVAYVVKQGARVLAYSGDTSTNDGLWQALNRHDRLDLLIVESAFANHDLKLAHLARHYCPSLLAADLKKLKHKPRLGISHLKPGEEQRIIEECRAALAGWELHQLASGDVFQL
ncbi:MAG: 3',5'-cyclic-nucleotide phosphodiesterase [Gammaproteobacteria bacterium]|nr:MAG: 3',5'-cyclic-nucleotide phosphodiesterase [Gammaproteobacteria bacterium]